MEKQIIVYILGIITGVLLLLVIQISIDTLKTEPEHKKCDHFEYYIIENKDGGKNSVGTRYISCEETSHNISYTNKEE